MPGANNGSKSDCSMPGFKESVVCLLKDADMPVSDFSTSILS